MRGSACAVTYGGNLATGDERVRLMLDAGVRLGMLTALASRKLYLSLELLSISSLSQRRKWQNAKDGSYALRSILGKVFLQVKFGLSISVGDLRSPFLKRTYLISIYPQPLPLHSLIF